MKSKIFIFLIGSLICISGIHAQEVPDDFYVEYHLWGWYGSPCNDIKYHISKSDSYFEVNCINNHVNRIAVSISENELFEIYMSIKQNEFQKIKSEKSKYVIADGGYSELKIQLDNMTHYVYTDGEYHINAESKNIFSNILTSIQSLFTNVKERIKLEFDDKLSKGEIPFTIIFDNGNIVYFDGGDFYYKDMAVDLYRGKNRLKITYGQTQYEKVFINLPEGAKEIFFFEEDSKIKFKIK